MLNYSYAQRLKENGFPQKELKYSWYYTNEGEIHNTGKNPFHSSLGTYCPRFEEIMEDLEKNFGGIDFFSLKGKYQGKWFITVKLKGKKAIRAEGNIQNVVLAEIWLKLA
ncbi:hypothetical protein KY314_00360 [Candidatus Woesearchaeota archaeon]|nr:hypothetical protein [Candidatus Woesearchaeota archaeon]